MLTMKIQMAACSNGLQVPNGDVTITHISATVELNLTRRLKYRKAGHPRTSTSSYHLPFRMSATNGPSSATDEAALAAKAKQASLILGALSLTQRNSALQKINDTLLAKQNEILAANKLDMQVPHS